MPVRKFRSIEDVAPPEPLAPLTPETLRRAIDNLDLSLRLFPLHLPPGVHKFRTMEDANRCREEQLRGQVRLKRAER